MINIAREQQRLGSGSSLTIWQFGMRDGLDSMKLLSQPKTKFQLGWISIIRFGKRKNSTWKNSQLGKILPPRFLHRLLRRLDASSPLECERNGGSPVLNRRLWSVSIFNSSFWISDFWAAVAILSNKMLVLDSRICYNSLTEQHFWARGVGSGFNESLFGTQSRCQHLAKYSPNSYFEMKGGLTMWNYLAKLRRYA